MFIIKEKLNFSSFIILTCRKIRGYSILLLLILIIATTTRNIGIDFGLPYATGARPDELVIIRHTLPFGLGDLNPHFFNYPTLFLYLLFFLFAIYFFIGKLFGWFQNTIDFAATILLNPSPLILIARLTSAILGTLTIYIIYLTFRDKDKEAALISSSLFSLAYLHIQQSHFGTTDVPMLFFGMLSFFFANQVFAKGKIRDYVVSGVFAGLAASTKYNGAVFLIPLVFSFLLRLKLDSIRSSLIKIILGITSSCVSFLLFSPFVLLDFPTFHSDFLRESNRLLTGTVINLGRGWIKFINFSLLHGIGLPLLLFSFLAIIILLVKRTRFTVFLISFPLTYYIFIGAGRVVYVRHVLPIVPFLCIVAAFFLKDLFRYVKGATRPIGLILVILLLLSGSIKNLTGYLTTITKEDTRVQTAKWIIKNIKENSTIGWVGSAWSIPNLPYSTQEIDSRFSQSRIGISLSSKIIQKMKAKVNNTGYRIVRYNKEKADSDTLRFFKIDQIKERNIAYLVITSYPDFPFGRLPKEISALTKDTTKYLLQIQFNPFVNENAKPLMDKQDASYTPFANFKNVQRPGPLISVYRIKHL